MVDTIKAEETSRKKTELPDDKEGAVTFLDVLGWKGIWEKRSDALDTLFNFVGEIRTISDRITTTYGSTENSMRAAKTTILSVSDTIAIFTQRPKQADPIHTLQIHAKICSFIIPESIKRCIPVRGATSFGKFSTKEAIMIGPAVDEAASWHEAHDWIGVTLTPSAKLKINRKIAMGWREYKPPYKNKGFGCTGCVEWEFNETGKSIEEYFYEMGPHIPEIAAKYSNTLDFLDNLKKSKEECEKDN